MLSPFKDFFHYSRGERRGVFLLVILIGVLLLFYFFRGFFHGSVDSDFQEFQAEVEAFQESKSKDVLENDTIQYFLFNPNEIGEAEWMQLGFSEKQAASIEKYKSSGAIFKVKKDLLKLFMVDEFKYAQLEPYIDLPETISYGNSDFSKDNYNSYSESKNPKDKPIHIVILQKSAVPVYSGFENMDSVYYTKREDFYWYCILPFEDKTIALQYLAKSKFKNAEIIEVPSLKGFYPVVQKYKDVKQIVLEININTADTTEFKKVPGIGSGYAKRIIKYRSALGGFISVSQMKETYNLPADLIDKNLSYFKIEPNQITKININTVSVEELRKHPYLNWNIANSIVQMRNVHGKFAKVEDIKKSDLINEELFLKIVPYLSIE